MARIVADRVQETSTTTGTGAYTLAGATLGFRAASTVCANGDTFSYHAEDVDANGRLLGGWETGLGTWSTGGVLTRTTVYASTNANAAVSWAAGTRRISLSLVATASLGPTTVTGALAVSGAITSGWGIAGATGAVGNPVFYENDQTVTADYTLTSGKNAMTAGPITINTGVTVTIPTGATWSVI